MSIWRSRDEQQRPIDRLHLQQAAIKMLEQDGQASDESTAEAEETSEQPATEAHEQSSDGFVSAERPEAEPAPAPMPVEANDADRPVRHDAGDWERTQQLARGLVGLDSFRNSLHAMPPEEFARILLDRVDDAVMSVGSHLAEGLRQGHDAGSSPPAEVRAAAAIVEWLVTALEQLGVEGDEPLSSVYPSLASIRRAAA